MTSITFDTGALIALERGDARIRVALRTAEQCGVAITVPAVVVAEWWRADSKRNRLMLSSFTIEPTTERLARIAGEAMAQVPNRDGDRRHRHGVGGPARGHGLHFGPR